MRENSEHLACLAPDFLCLGAFLEPHRLSLMDSDWIRKDSGVILDAMERSVID